MEKDAHGRRTTHVRTCFNETTGRHSKIAVNFSEKNDGKKTRSYSISASRLSQAKGEKVLVQARKLKAARSGLGSLGAIDAIEISDDEAADARAMLVEIESD